MTSALVCLIQFVSMIDYALDLVLREKPLPTQDSVEVI
jgi:hypothetical protein